MSYIEYEKHIVEDLLNFTVDSKAPTNPNSMGLKQKIIRDDIPGFGIYALSFHHPEFGEKLIYVGKYQGGDTINKNNEYAGLSGNIVEQRWYKHILTCTMKGSINTIGLTKGVFQNLSQRLKTHPLEYDVDFLTKTSDSDFKSDRGIKSSYNRAAFACQMYPLFNHESGDLYIDAKVIPSLFSFHYWRVTPGFLSQWEAPLPTCIARSKPNLSEVEDNVIQKYKRQLPINKEYVPLDFPEVFHFNPKDLIDCSSSEFDDFSKEIFNTTLNAIT